MLFQKAFTKKLIFCGFIASFIDIELSSTDLENWFVIREFISYKGPFIFYEHGGAGGI